MDKVIISAAPVSAAPHPIDPDELAREVGRCRDAGAAVVHLHARDREGLLTDDMDVLSLCLCKIRALCDIVIQVSTGGVSDMTIAQRCLPIHLAESESCSLNVGSVNLGGAVYRNAPDDVETCVRTIVQAGRRAEIEVFEIGMIGTVRELDAKFSLPRPLVMNLVTGHRGEAPATAQALTSLWLMLSPEERELWGFTQANRSDLALMACALGLGARLIRIGFEDSALLFGKEASGNAELVGALVKLVRAAGLEPASPAEARSMLGIAPLAARCD